MAMTEPKPRPPTKAERLDAQLREIVARMKPMSNWAVLTADVKCPPEIAAALATGRPELVRAATPRALTVEECRDLYGLIGTLIETNAALIEHAQAVSQLANNWADAFIALRSLGRQIERFAAFKSIEEDDEDD